MSDVLLSSTETEHTKNGLAEKNRRLLARIFIALAFSTAFAILLVPLYSVFCQITGLNGKTANEAPSFAEGGFLGNAVDSNKGVDTGRLVNIEFVGMTMRGLPWTIRPLTSQLKIHPGELQTVRYLVFNESNETIVGQAIPSVTPGQAASHFSKIECFCFTQQKLLPGESREMPVTFLVKKDLDPDIQHVTLSYAFFKAPEQLVQNDTTIR